MNNNILPDNEVVQFEDRLYVNPQTSLDEQNSFIDNLRNVQNTNNAEINAQTRNLGTDVPSNFGGLVGGEGYFTSRYQTPQTNAVAASLRATAQAQALNDVLSNELALHKQRYNNAYKAAQRRANTPQGNEEEPYDRIDPDEYNAGYGSGTVSNKGLKPGTTRTAYVLDGYSYTQDKLADGRTVIFNTDNPAYTQANNGYWYRTTVGASEKRRKEEANRLAAKQLLEEAARQAGITKTGSWGGR